MSRARIGPFLADLRARLRLPDEWPARLRAIRLVPRTLRGRIAWMAALLTAAGIFSLWSMQARTTRQTVQAMLEGQQQSLARRGADEVGEKLGLSFGILKALSKAVPPERLDDAAALQAFLESRRALMDVYQSVGLLRPDGKVLAQVPIGPGSRRVASLGEQEPLRQTLATGRPAVSAPLVNRATGHKHVLLTLPIKDGQGRVQAVAAGGLDPMRPNLLASLTRQPIGTDGFFMVVTRSGTIVSHRDAALMGVAASTLPGLGEAFERDLRGGRSLRYARSPSGERSLLAFEPVPNSDWVVVAVRPERELVQPLVRMAGDDIARGALAALLVGAGLWLVLYWLLQPLERLKLDLVRLRAQPAESCGQLATTSGAEELSSLVREFNALSAARAQAHRELAALKHRAQATLGSIGDAVVAIDRHGRIDVFNAAAERLTGWHAVDAIGRPLDEVLRLAREGAEQPERYLHRRALDAAAPGTLVQQAELVTRDGSRVAVDDTVAPMRDANGCTLGAVICLRDVGIARAVAAELAWKATHDPLTGLLNRAGFDQVLRDGCARVAAGQPHTLLLMDLDGFKAVNDHGGHDAGDELLRAVAGALRLTLHEEDRVARLGGDEFGVLLPGCTLRDAAGVGRRLCAAVAGLRVAHGGAVHRVRVSIGASELGGQPEARAAAMRAADVACFAAKRAGKNRTCLAGDEPVEAAAAVSSAMAELV